MTNPHPSCVHPTCTRRTRDHITFLCGLHSPSAVEKRKINNQKFREQHPKPLTVKSKCKYYTCNRTTKREYCGQHNPVTMAKKRAASKQFYKNTEQTIVPDDSLQSILESMDNVLEINNEPFQWK
jgi:hypothetical protein